MWRLAVGIREDNKDEGKGAGSRPLTKHASCTAVPSNFMIQPSLELFQYMRFFDKPLTHKILFIARISISLWLSSHFSQGLKLFLVSVND